MKKREFKIALKRVSKGDQISFTGHSLTQEQIDKLKKAIDCFVADKSPEDQAEYDEYFRQCIKTRFFR